MANEVHILDVECADILDVDCIVEKLVEVEELERIDIDVRDVECVDERLIEVKCHENQGILDVHCVVERLAGIEEILDCIQVGAW